MVGIGLVELVVLIVVIVGGIGTLVWLAWPHVKRHPRWALGAVIVLLAAASLWWISLRGDRGRRVRIVNESRKAYVVVLKQGGRKTALGTFGPQEMRTLRIHPERGPVDVVITAEGETDPSCSLGFSLLGPMLFPPSATIRMKADGSFENRVGPSILGF